jgi:hypothetical protein
MFCFSTDVQGHHHSLLFPTISKHLANFNPEWKKALVMALQEDDNLFKTSSLQLQFQELLLNLAVSMDERVVGPIVVVIDALDECGDGAARRELLHYIARLTQLPSFFRFLITARPDQDMVDGLAELKHVCHHNLAREDQHNTDKDIWIMVDHKLSNEPRITRDSHWNISMINQLVAAAEQSFQRASTACDFIQGIGESYELNWHDRFKVVIDASKKQPSGLKYQPLNKLYTAILEQFFPSSKPLKRFKQIVGCVLAVRKPISLNTLKELYGASKEQQWTTDILGALGSLLYGVSQADTPIQPLHSSFREFLTDQSKSGDYFINLNSGEYDSTLAYSTLHSMNNRLKFNMCQLETSYCFNMNDDSFKKHVQQCLSPGLVYSVQYWAEHLEHVKYDTFLQEDIKRLLEEKVLFWIESLSLLSQVHKIVPLLAIAKRWVSTVSIKQDDIRTS